MEILFVLVPVSLVIVMIALLAFVWSVNAKQYDDLDKEAERILFDDSVNANFANNENNPVREENT